ncbi:hypothetical protein [Aeromicrobium fastidiosum]|uniref:Uncharacterized protein n=1 Tax=Aeromicrobium fastidiosum TaxID=52699 RepID=A0A641AMU1_9ACTN|nr:hypothetical protein [Aeromicrobium fastidiosum]KAA1376122.1 hypothetical protein ESP62_011800 [Aeromicrobium fastidiosum]MBP2391998.1 hypothetical protein [Aeromicrobium fastidiosum]
MTQPLETPPESVETPPESTEPPEDARTEPETFSREYVETLRAESAENRLKAKKADDYLAALQSAAIEHTAGRVLQDASNLPWSDEFNDPESGMPSPELIRAAADSLAKEKPHLSKVGGPTQQGFRGNESDAEEVSLVGLLQG